MLRVVLPELVSSAAEKSQRKQPQNIRQNLNHQGEDSGGFFIKSEEQNTLENIQKNGGSWGNL